MMDQILDQYKVLVIEDNPGDLVLLNYYLKDALKNTQIFHASNFVSAKEILLKEAFNFHVILMDLSLPDKSGAGLIGEVVALCPNIPIIVLTGYEDMNLCAQSLNMGISDYILKDGLTALMLHNSIIKSLEQKKGNPTKKA
jgi:DNA-binding NarL/FixJ family response regulator